jgi:ribosomal protein RSM22 (predicted rRNA methylase)
MTGRLPDILEKLFKESGLTPSEVMARVERLSDAYERGGGPGITDANSALAYTLYFLPENIGKPALVAADLAAAGLLPAGRRLRVVDLGAGPGTAVWALAGALAGDGGPTIEATLVDRSAHLLAIARTIAAGYGERIHLQTVAADFTAWLSDLVW